MQFRLWTAIKESQSGQNGDLVRAVARACLSGSHGFKACANGFVLTPVPYSAVAEHIRADCPGISFRNDCSSATLDEEDSDNEEGEDAEEQQYHYYQDSYASSYSNQYTHDSDEESDDCDSNQDDDAAWTLTQLLDSDDCQRFFMVLRSFKGSQPYVIADLHALIERPQLDELRDVLPSVHTRAVHPDQLTHMTKQKAASDTSMADPQLIFSAVLAALEQTTLLNSQDITDADDIPAVLAKLMITVCRAFSEEVLDHMKPHWDVLTAAQVG